MFILIIESFRIETVQKITPVDPHTRTDMATRTCEQKAAEMELRRKHSETHNTSVLHGWQIKKKKNIGIKSQTN